MGKTKTPWLVFGSDPWVSRKVWLDPMEPRVENAAWLCHKILVKLCDIPTRAEAIRLVRTKPAKNSFHLVLEGDDGHILAGGGVSVDDSKPFDVYDAFYVWVAANGGDLWVEVEYK